jgi:hypothetical protein
MPGSHPLYRASLSGNALNLPRFQPRKGGDDGGSPGHAVVRPQTWGDTAGRWAGLAAYFALLSLARISSLDWTGWR